MKYAYCISALLLTTGLFCLTGALRLCAGDDLQIKDVVNLSQNNFDKIDNLQLAYDLDDVFEPPLPKQVTERQPRGSLSVHLWYSRDKYLIKTETITYSDSTRKHILGKEVVSWDGTKSYKLICQADPTTWELDNVQDGKQIDSGDGYIYYSNLTEYAARDLLDILRMKRNTIYGEPSDASRIEQVGVKVSGRPCVSILDPHGHLWVDQETGLIVKSEVYYPDMPTVCYRRCELVQMREFDGVWLPIEICHDVYYSKSVKAYRNYQDAHCKTHVSVDAKSIKVNKGLDKTIFVIDFPPGIPIYDEATKTWNKNPRQKSASDSKSELTIEQHLEELAQRAVKHRATQSK